VALNVALTVGLGLGTGLAHVGVAMALSIAGWANALTLSWMLARRGHFALDAGAKKRLPRLFVAALGMGVVVALLEWALRAQWDGPLPTQIAALAFLIAAGMAAFFLLAFALSGIDRDDLRRRLQRRAA
jgi:putative peptidoglycan lipid II flippase